MNAYQITDLITRTAEAALASKGKTDADLSAAASTVIALIESKAKGNATILAAMAAARRAYGLDNAESSDKPGK